jgi:hypothetical protein
LRAEEAYVAWLKRFLFFHGVRHTQEMGATEINPFLTHWAVYGQGLDSEPGVPSPPLSITEGAARASAEAVRQPQLGKRATTHSLRYSYAIYLWEDGYALRTVQERLGRVDVETTMVSTRVLDKRGGVTNPLEGL